MKTIEEACRAEVESLHAFFAAWFSGTLPRTENVFVRLGRALAPTFTMVTPGGEVRDRVQVIEGVESMHGAERDARIWIEGHEHRQSHGEIVVVTYEEWQTRDGVTRGRVSSAVFEAFPGAPCGVRWLHLHECWKP